MYIVRFIRIDNKVNEEYYYHTLEEANKHIELFVDDDSGLYEEIQVIDWNTSEKILSSLKCI